MAFHLASTAPLATLPFAWVQRASRQFARLALFEVRGRAARVCHGTGIDPAALGRDLPLMDPTPLRWALEAASVVVGSGRAPGADGLTRLLGVSSPRAFAVVPIMESGKLVAFVYVDHDRQPLPRAAVRELWAYADSEQPRPARLKSSRRFAGKRQLRPPALFHRPTITFEEEETAAAEPVLREPPEEIAPKEILIDAADLIEDLPAIEVVYEEPAVLRLELDPVAPAALDWPEEDAPQSFLRPWRWALAACLFATAASIFAVAPGRFTGDAAVITIPQQASPAQIGTVLFDAGVIRSRLAFQLYARVTHADRSLRAGTYQIEPGIWLGGVLRELVAGQVHTISFTIPEGLSLRAVAAQMEKNRVVSAQDFLAAASDPELLKRFGLVGASPEGFLFPETYKVARGSTASAIVEVMLAEFRRRFDNIPGATLLTPDERHAVVTLAALIQAETKHTQEMSTVAGVFYNRLREDMRLESCATVQYLLDAPKERLTLQDIRIPSSYNTYLHKGLPPGPIGNPGLAALKAALDPEPHDFKFFFANPDGNGHHVFTRTFIDHKRAQRRLAYGTEG